MLVLRRGLRDRPRRRRATPTGRRGRARRPRGQGAPGERRPAVHQGRDERRHAGRAGRPGDHALVRAERGAEPRATRTSTRRSPSRARRLRAVVDEHGPDAFALYVSGQMSLEAQYLANKLAKGFIAHATRSSRTRGCAWPAPGRGYKLSLGADGPPGSYDDLDHADVFLVIGSNMADCHPILFLRHAGPGQGGRQADRRRPAPHRDRRQGRPVPAGRARAPTSRCSTGCCTCSSRRAGSTTSSSPSTPRAGSDARGLPRRLPARRGRATSPASPRPTCARRPRMIGGRGRTG